MQRRFMLSLCSFALVTSTIFVKGQEAKHRSSPKTVADLLDKLVQPRFLQDAGKFGMDRLVIVGHEDQSDHKDETVYQLEAQNGKEKTLLHAANAAKRDYAIGFLHCAHKPGKFLPKSKTNAGSTSESISSGSNFEMLVIREDDQNLYGTSDDFQAEDWTTPNLDGINRAVKKNLLRLKQGQAVDVNMKRLFLALRPIRASKDACLSCHHGAKRGDTLGIMVYAVSAKTRQN